MSIYKIFYPGLGALSIRMVDYFILKEVDILKNGKV